MKESVTVQDVLDLLNSAVVLDREAMTALFDGRGARKVCNEALANHPTIQVEADAETYRVGPLGILNGLFGVDAKGLGPISMRIESDGTLLEFHRTDPEKYPPT